MRLPLGALQSPVQSRCAGQRENVGRRAVCIGLAGRMKESLVFRVFREHEIAGSNPAILTCIAVGPVLVQAGGLLSVTTQVRFLPPQRVVRKVKPIGDGTPFEAGRASPP